jgi:hypothetical protein
MHLVATDRQDAVECEVPQPGFKDKRALQAAEENRFLAPSFFDGFNQSLRVDDP